MVIRLQKCRNEVTGSLTAKQCRSDGTGDTGGRVAVCSCSSGSGLVSPFVGQGPSGAQAVTDSFQAFKFTSYDTIFFQCVADFCYGDNDLACLGVGALCFEK